MKLSRHSFALCLTAASLTAAPQAILFEGARLIVDARRAPIDNSAFLVDGGRIAAVGARGAVPAPASAMHVDLTGKTVIPALIDTHIHIGYQKDLVYSADNYTHENLTDQLHRYAYAGISAVLTLGTDPGKLPLELRAEQERTAGVLFRLAGRGIAAPNAGPADPALKPSAYGVTTPEEARRAVREQLANKVDFIKIWVDDRNGTVKKLSPELYRAAIDEVHKHGARVIAHVYYLDDAKDLARAGIDGFAHLVRDRELDDETVALIKQKNVLVMPNLTLAESRTYAAAPAWLNDPLYREVTPAPIVARVTTFYANRPAAAVENAQKTYRIMQRNLAKLNSAGARVGFGADSGAAPDHFHAYTTHRELQLMVEAGMTPVQALTAATVTSGAFLRLPRHGTLDAGSSADFIVLDANPLDDIANTKKISKVYLRGQEVDRAALRQAWK
ncbi:MAG TPA: amidohydrolase family protein [Bryobacteraceae bacterium]|nr:amidohydrolase family protein [Bryobacteraceae bacterium]